ncbi:hypothetical protein C8F04DRAFT_1276382 [Mycena alexandri]|uniref:Uncharacterized protein n=1 Tax=Mycena alexandri TaxID=1745969 RepID=A0AAD6WNN2_9AGAR|nr:hypothetical protein C8F04DRAFT_1276382 [Mycena alexandri]
MSRRTNRSALCHRHAFVTAGASAYCPLSSSRVWAPRCSWTTDCFVLRRREFRRPLLSYQAFPGLYVRAGLTRRPLHVSILVPASETAILATSPIFAGISRLDGHTLCAARVHADMTIYLSSSHRRRFNNNTVFYPVDQTPHDTATPLSARRSRFTLVHDRQRTTTSVLCFRHLPLPGTHTEFRPTPPPPPPGVHVPVDSTLLVQQVRAAHVVDPPSCVSANEETSSFPRTTHTELSSSRPSPRRVHVRGDSTLLV